MDFDNYVYDDSVESEQLNTLILLDNVFAKKDLKAKPVFHILGGTALAFHGFKAVVTIDIDTANALPTHVKDVVEPFVSDNASEVAILASGYKERLIPYKSEVFKHIEVYLLSIEDLVITKLGASRYKDVDDLTKNGLLKKCDYDKLFSIINTELDTQTASTLLVKLSTL